ncbi:hypothetical protein NVP1155O_19 [Vibrio phage 1.155.O._10N.222.55.B3]|nr:hypothetical protein NVP1155O_19 [Vibrio phage 1.155.O._10N.222.55.B3]
MKVYDCEVSAGTVTITNSDGASVDVPDAVLMSAGVTKSSGKLIISENGAVYIVNTQPDLQVIINKMGDMLGQISTLAKVLVSRSPDSAPLEPQVAIDAEALKAELEAMKLI